MYFHLFPVFYGLQFSRISELALFFVSDNKCKTLSVSYKLIQLKQPENWLQTSGRHGSDEDDLS